MKKLLTLLFFTVAVFIFTARPVYAKNWVHVRVFFESYYDSTQNKMVPVVDPVYSPNLFDTITIELRKPNGVFQASLKVLVDVNGYGSANFPPLPSNSSFYIIIKHRNSIETWSTAPIVFPPWNGPVTYDFTTVVTQAFGNNLKWMGNAACIYSGDFNQDDNIDLLDYLIWDNQSLNSPFGYYLLCDLTGDLIVDVNDYLFWSTNYTAFIYAHYPAFVGVDDLGVSQSVEIYPNPADHQINIVINDLIIEEANVYSLSGKEIEKIKIKNASSSLDISKYVAGIYLIKFDSGKNEYTQKFVVEH